MAAKKPKRNTKSAKSAKKVAKSPKKAVKSPKKAPSRPQRAAAEARGLAAAAALPMVRMARQRKAMQDQAARDRDARFAEYLRKVPEPARPPGTRSLAALTRGGEPVPELRILAEGDSWFEYPKRGIFLGRGIDGVIDRLEKLLDCSIANMAYHGDEVRQMLGCSQRRELIDRLSSPEVRFDALLFSGGGNDLVGDPLCLLLKDAQLGAAPEDLLYPQRVAAAMELLRAGYMDLVAIRNHYSPGTAIFLHGYDFPPVTGIGVCGVGPWLKPSLDFHNVAVGNDQYRVVRKLLEQFQAMLKEVAAASQDVIVVETQGTLVPDHPDWQNEIHPSQDGFVKIARKFHDAIRARFP